MKPTPLSLRDRLYQAYRRLRDSRPAAPQCEPIQGRQSRVIVIPSPDTRYFREAVFVLCDDLFTRPGIGQIAILNEAHRAAEGITQRYALPRQRRPTGAVLLFLLGGILGFCLSHFLL